MLTTIAMLLLILWLFAMVAGVDFGGFVWIFFITALVLLTVRYVVGRRII